MLHSSHMMYMHGFHKSPVTPMQIESRTVENYNYQFDELLTKEKDFGLQPTKFAVGIFQPSIEATLGAADRHTRNSPAFVLQYTVMQAGDFLAFWNSHCKSNLQKVSLTRCVDQMAPSGSFRLCLATSLQIGTW